MPTSACSNSTTEARRTATSRRSSTNSGAWRRFRLKSPSATFAARIATSSATPTNALEPRKRRELRVQLSDLFHVHGPQINRSRAHGVVTQNSREGIDVTAVFDIRDREEVPERVRRDPRPLDAQARAEDQDVAMRVAVREPRARRRPEQQVATELALRHHLVIAKQRLPQACRERH